MKKILLVAGCAALCFFANGCSTGESAPASPDDVVRRDEAMTTQNYKFKALVGERTEPAQFEELRGARLARISSVDDPALNLLRKLGDVYNHNATADGGQPFDMIFTSSDMNERLKNTPVLVYRKNASFAELYDRICLQTEMAWWVRDGKVFFALPGATTE